MKILTLPLPLLGFIVSTRAALGAGLGLLLADRLSAQQRRAAGLALTAIGVATTIPALALVRRQSRRSRNGRSALGSDPRLIGATRFPRKGDDDTL